MLDFQRVKAAASIEAVAKWLGIELKRHGDQWRSACPFCDGTSDRAFVVTPAKGLWYTFCPSCQSGGDSLELVARVKGVSVKDAAKLIDDHFNGTTPAKKEEPLKPLDYLDPDHEALKPLGLMPDTLKSWGAGYKPRGVLTGRLAVPIYRKGKLLAYVGIALKKGQEPLLAYPAGFEPAGIIFNEDAIEPGTLMLCDSPLKVLVASQLDMKNAVALLGTITPDAIASLAELMKDKGIERVEFF